MTSKVSVEDLAHSLVGQCTTVYRVSEEVVEKDNVIQVFGYPHVDDANPTEEIHNLHFIAVGVDKAHAEHLEYIFIEIMESYPNQERLKGGPTYIEVGYEVGDQEVALRLFAVGATLGYWRIVTPATLHMEGEKADHLAGLGFIMVDGYTGRKTDDYAQR